MTTPNHIMPPLQDTGPLETMEIPQASNTVSPPIEFSAEHDADTYTIFFPDGHALTAWESGRIIITKAEAGFVPFVVTLAALVNTKEGE